MVVKKDKDIKKRGRPPKKLTLEKDKTSHITNINNYFNTKTELPLDDSDSEEIILFLKNAKTSDIVSDNNFNSQDIFDIGDFDMTDNSDEEEKVSTKYISKISDYEKEIADLKNKIELMEKEYASSVYVDKYVESFSKLLDLNLLDSHTNKHVLVLQTNTRCWRCCYKFRNFPCPIIWKKFEDNYYIFGNFCTPSCAVGYNLSMDDYKKNDRHSLTVNFYADLLGIPKENIKPSPAKEVLKKFGGYLEIDEYRNSTIKLDVDYRLVLPPMKSIYPIIECRSANASTKSDTDFVIKRKNPLPQAKSYFS